MICTCDQPTCNEFPCKSLREYRVAHKVITDIVKTLDATVATGQSIRPDTGWTVQDILDIIKFECEILQVV